MKAFPFVLLPCVLFGCTEEPTRQEGEKAAAVLEAASDEEAVKAEQKSIEQAADAAAKLIEDETRDEIGQLEAEQAEE